MAATRSKSSTGKANGTAQELRLPALEIQQGPGRRLYTFAIDGKQIPRFAAVSRVRRDSETKLHGYQRPEVLSHVSAIRRYIESEAPILPNSIVIAFNERTRFIPDGPVSKDVGYVRSGTLVIPVDDRWEDADKPGFIVDGQQRCAAIRDARVEAFPVCVTGFITDELAEQRSQFILVNSTKPLPKGLIHELLPDATGALPVPLMVRRLPATLLEQLNFDQHSPLARMIQTPTNPAGVIKDNSMLKMLENSLSDGALYRFRGGEGEAPNIGFMMTMLKNFWDAVREVFPDAWNQPPRKSRLMHGAGIVSMGFLMDAIAGARAGGGIVDFNDFAADLKTIKDYCHWTDGNWEFDDGAVRKWNDIQNTPRDIQRVTDFLLSRYRSLSPVPARRRR